MAPTIFLGSVVLFLLFLGLSQVSDPGVFGIHEEPDRILFYGGSGLLAGLSGLVAVGSGIYLGATRFARLSKAPRRILLTMMWIVLIAVLIALAVRLSPIR